MRRMSYIPWVGLPNILAREFVVPEFLQEAATPEALADAMMVPARRRRPIGVGSRSASHAMHETLRRDTGERAATVIAGLLDGRR